MQATTGSSLEGNEEKIPKEKGEGKIKGNDPNNEKYKKNVTKIKQIIIMINVNLK